MFIEPSFVVQATGSNDIMFMEIDLGSFKSVRAFAENFLKSESRLDLLINNAGTPNQQYCFNSDCNQCLAILIKHYLNIMGNVWHGIQRLFMFRSCGGWSNRGWFWHRVWCQPSWPFSAHMSSVGSSERESCCSSYHTILYGLSLGQD